MLFICDPFFYEIFAPETKTFENNTGFYMFI